MAYGRAFRDPEVLKEMLSRYKAGESTTVLGQAYGVDHTSIIYQTQKAGLSKRGLPDRRKLRRVHMTMDEMQQHQANKNATTRLLIEQSLTAHGSVLGASLKAGVSTRTVFKYIALYPDLKKLVIPMQKGRPKGNIQYKYQHLFDEENRRNPGHTYSEYLREYNRKMKPIRAEAMSKAKAEMVERKRLIKQGKLPHYFDETVFNASFGPSKSYPQPVDMMEES